MFHYWGYGGTGDGIGGTAGVGKIVGGAAGAGDFAGINFGNPKDLSAEGFFGWCHVRVY